MDRVTAEWVLTQRDMRYRRTPALALQSEQDARSFVDAVGFCFFWPIKDIEMPNLLHAIAGRVRPAPVKHDDPDGSRCWAWKDGALGKKWWYYGKLLRQRATLVSWDLLAAFYASSRNFGGLDDYLQEYRDGLLTVEARQVYEALLEHGALDTVRLRKESRMSADGAKARFDRALTELQVGLKVLPVGVARVGAWRYAFVYDIVPRYLPDLPEQARRIERRQARQILVGQYVDDVVAVERGMVRRVFHVFGWTAAEWEQTFAALRQSGVLGEIEVGGWAQPAFLSLRYKSGGGYD